MSPAPRWLRRTLGVAFAAMTLLALTACFLWFEDFGLVILRSAARPVPLTVLAAALLVGWLIALGAHWRIGGYVLGAVCSIALVVATPLYLLVTSGTGMPDRRLLSPDSSTVLIVENDAAMIDPIWPVRLEQTSGLTAKYWDIGCINGDYLEYTGAQWMSDSLIEFTISGERVPLQVGPDGPTGTTDPRLRSC
ncbi:hypothetical protein [Branchiibius cervicis]|uniref:DUF1109 domain-containing protein n=1 Tax=Branchiibius cervicis TaxID=908252 RepID=A0ABW2APR6_9MICO